MQIIFCGHALSRRPEKVVEDFFGSYPYTRYRTSLIGIRRNSGKTFTGCNFNPTAGANDAQTAVPPALGGVGPEINHGVVHANSCQGVNQTPCGLSLTFNSPFTSISYSSAGASRTLTSTPPSTAAFGLPTLLSNQLEDVATVTLRELSGSCLRVE